MEKEQTKENILPSTKTINLMELFPKILNVDKEIFTMTPSEYIKEMSLSTEDRYKKLLRNTLKSGKSEYPPDFRIVPQVLMFQKFEAMTTKRLLLEVKNVGKSSLSVKMHCPNSMYFSANFAGAATNKLAPGLSVVFEIIFTPKEEKDYYHHLVLASKTHCFQVPIVAIGPRPMLDVPDQIILNPSPVKIATSKYIVVRNIGNAPAVFNFISEGKHFQVSPSKGILVARDSMLLNISFESSVVKEVTENLYLTLETGEKFCITLHGSAENVSIRLDKNSVVHDDTFIGLKRCKTIRLINNSSNMIKFSWKKNKSQKEDLEIIESMKKKCKTLSELEELKDTKVIYYGLGSSEKHKLSCERILNDDLRLLEKEDFKFSNKSFCIVPDSGEVWPKSSLEIMTSFQPSAAGLACANAYLEVSGRDSRLPLRMKGNGLGPKIVLNVKTLDIDHVYLCSLHRYEVTVENKGDIPGTVEYQMEPMIFGGRAEVMPQCKHLKVGELGAFVITFKSNRPGEFIEKLYFYIKESGEKLCLVFKGKVISPTLHFDIKQLDFGIVPFGIPIKREVTLNNLSVVPVMFSLRVLPDGEFASISCEEYGTFNIKPIVPLNPKEFDVNPEESVVEPFSSKKVTVTLTANRPGKYQKQLVVDMWDSENGSVSCPIKYRAAVATLLADPETIIVPFCFLNYPYTKWITLNNVSSVTGFFYIIPPDKTETSITFSASISQGVIEPGESIKIDITIITSVLGRQEFPINMLTFGNDDPQEVCIISCMGQGPLVTVKPPTLNWGDVLLLQTVEKQLEFLNESPVPATLSLCLAKPNFLWNVDTRYVKILPQKSASVTISLLLKDRGKFKDTLKVNIYNGKDLQVPLSATGIGSSLQITPNISPTYELGALFSQKQYAFEICIENKGNKMYGLVWSPLAEYKTFANAKFIMPEDNVFKLNPSKMDIAPAERKSLILEVLSPSSGHFAQTFYCFAAFGSPNKELHLTSEVSAEFAGPTITCDKEEISFWNNIGPDISDLQLNDTISLKNASVLPLNFEVATSQPFCFEMEPGNCLYNVEMNLNGLESTELNVKFSAPPNQKKVSKTYHGKLVITFKDHPKKSYINLIGKINYPSVSLVPRNVDFGFVQVGTSACMEVLLENVSPLSVYYTIKWDARASQVSHTEEENPVTQKTSELHEELVVPTCETETGEVFTEEIQRVEDESLRNENFPDGSQNSVPPIKPTVRMPEINISNTDIKTALFPMTRNYYICDNELIEAYKLVRSSDTENAEIREEFTNYCDITPFYGKLEPQSNQILTVVFASNTPVKLHAEAVISIESGSREVITIDAISCEVDFELSTTELDFGKQLFCETKSQALKLKNTAAVPFFYKAETDAECDRQTEENFPMGTGVMTVSPSSGIVNSSETVELIVRYHPGVPGIFEKNFQLQISHLEPISVLVKGCGVFPQVYVTLPRPEILKITPEIGYSAVASLTPDWILTEFPSKHCMHHLDSLKPYRSRESNLDGFLEDDEKDGRWELIRYLDYVPSEIDIYLAVERILAYNLISKKANNSMFAVYARTIPRFTVPAYNLDFGVCMIGRVMERQVTIMNFGPLPVVIYGIFDSRLKDDGVYVRLKNRNEMKVGGCLSFIVNFYPKKTKYNKKYYKVSFVFYFEIYHGPKIPIKILAEVTYPHVVPSMHILNFEEVVCGCCKVISLRLKNPGYVSARWNLVTKKAAGDVPVPNYADAKDGKFVFHVDQISGLLNPNEYCTVQVYFKPTTGDIFSAVLHVQVLKSLENVKIILLGSGIEPRLSISKKLLNFKSTLPFPNKAEKVFSVSNPCPFPVEFYFPEFDEQIFEEERILRAITLYYRTDEILLPVRNPGEGLPVEIVEFYHMLLDGLNAKFMEEEREKILAERERDSFEEFDEDALQTGSQASFTDTKKKKKFKKLSRSRTSMETSREFLGGNSNGREPIVPSIFEQKTTEEIEAMLEDYINSLWNTHHLYDPVQASMKNILPPVKEEEYTEGTLIICHGAPFSNSVQLANRLGIVVNMPALNIDNIVLTEAALGRCEAGLTAKDLIEQAYSEYIGADSKDITPFNELENPELLISEGTFNFDKNFQQIQLKFEALLKLRESLTAEKQKNGKPGTAKSDISRKVDKTGSAGKPQMNVNAPIANITEDLVVDILRYRMTLEVGEGLIIESLQSVLVSSPTNALISLLKAVGNIKDIIVIFFITNYEQHVLNQLNAQTEQELARFYVREEIFKILEEEPEEVFDNLNLAPEEANMFRTNFIANRHEAHLMFEKKKETFYEMERLKRDALKNGLPVDHLPANMPLDSVSQAEKKEKDTVKKKETKVPKTAESKTSRKTESASRSARPKRDSLEGDFLSFDMDLIEMRKIIDNWDQRLGALVIDSVPEVKTKKGQTPRKESSTINKPKDGRGVFLWLVDVAKLYNNAFPACCSYLKKCVREKHVPSESDGWPLKSAESLILSVVPSPERRIREPIQHVFTISATENIVLMGEDHYEYLGEYSGITPVLNPKLNRSVSSVSLKSKKKESRASKKRKTDSRMSTDMRGHRFKKVISSAVFEENQLRPRWILLPGETQSYRVKYYPVEIGDFKQNYEINLVSWRNEDVIRCKGTCDFPQINMKPEVVFPAVEHNKPLSSIYGPAYYYSEEAYDFGSIIIFQSSSGKKSTEKSAVFTFCNISTLPVDLCIVHSEEGTSEEILGAEKFQVLPDKLWIKPREKKKVKVTVSPLRNGVMTQTLLLLIKDNPQVESIKISCEGVKPNVSVNPKIVNFERLLLRRKDFRRVVLSNENMIPLYFILTNLAELPQQLTFSHCSGLIPPLGSFNMQVYYEATEVQIFSEKTVQLQIFDSPESLECVQDLHFVIGAEAYDAALDVIFPNLGDDHIDFGDIRIENQYTIEFNLKNVGKYPLGYKFDIDTAFLSDSGNEQFYVIPQDGKLLPGKLFPVTLTFMAQNEVVWKREPLFKIVLVEPFCADELIASIPIEVSARSHFSRYEITPSEELNFGHIRAGSEATASLLIKNQGHFSLSYYIELQSSGNLTEDNIETKKSSKLSSSSKEKGDKWKKNLNSAFKAGIFEITPSSGTVETRQTGVVSISCCPNDVKSYQEKIVILVNESQPHLKKGNPVIISAEACIPQINFEDLQSIYREHFYCKDEAELNSRSKPGSYTMYSKNNNLFSFKNICVNKTREARIHLQNVGMIDCNVTAFVGPPPDEDDTRSGFTTGGGNGYFKVSPEKLIIEPYSSGCLLLSFQPDALEEYKGRLTITLEMPDTYKNEVHIVELRGNGILPQIEITEPNTKLPEGQALVNFPPTSPGHTSTASIAFSNTGVLDCKVIIELYKKNDGIFSLSPKPGSEKTLKVWELAKPIEHTAIVSLSPGQVAEFNVTFNPQEIQSYSSLIKLFIVDNPFENWCYKLMGEVFMEEVIIEKIRTSMTFLGADESDNKSSIPVAPGQYYINFGECQVKKKSKVLLRLSNKTEKDYFKFEWDEVQCISISPAVGHLYPNSYKEILLVFYPEEPMELEDMTISCLLNKIQIGNPTEPSWDSRLMQCQKQKGDTSARSYDKNSVYQPPDIVNAFGEEPAHDVVPESNRQLYVNLSGIADYTRLHCETTKVIFKNTFMFQTRVYSLVLENSGNIALDYKLNLKPVTVWPVKENKKSQVDEQQLLKFYRSNSRPQSSNQLRSRTDSAQLPTVSSRCGKGPRPFTSVSVLDLNRSTSESDEQIAVESSTEPKTAFFNPFSIENATGRILSKEKATCSIIFSPMEINEYRTAVSIQVANLHPEWSLPTIEVTASSIMPYCHFDIPESDYLESGRRDYSRPGPVGYSPGVPLHPDTKTIEVKVLGVGVTTPIKFHGINPTEEDYTFSWVNTSQVQPDVVPSFHCSTVDGWIRAGRQQLMVFNFVSQKTGITESFWKFSIPKYGVETPFLLVGDVREPSVYFLSNHVNLMPTLIGSSSYDVITLANHEENSFEFSFLHESLYSEGRQNFLEVEPSAGKIPGNSEMTVRVIFTGKTPGKTLFKVRCKVKSVKEPFVISVEATTYVVQPLVVLEDLSKVKQYAELNKENFIDFGSELTPNSPETVTMTLTSLSKTLFYYEWEYDEKFLEARHCSLRFSTRCGHVAAFSRGKCDITITFQKKSSLMNFPLKLKIRRGPTFDFLVRGSASTPLCEFSFISYDFGYCFLQEKDICFNKTSLVVKNKDTIDLFLECALEGSSAFSYFLSENVVHPLEEIVIPICFHPKECIPYENMLKFTINGSHKRVVQLTGHGTDFKVTLADVEDTTISLGAVKVGKTSTRKFSLVNKSLATATLLVGFSDQLPVTGSHLSLEQKSPLDLSQDHRLTGVITISPSTVFKIKPHESFTLSVTYSPTQRSPPFSETVYLQCQERAEPLCLLTGCCLGPEITLDRKFLNFGAVVKSCTTSLRLKLVNYGSIGARFEWNTKELTEYIISPAFGYCSPESDVTITVTFCPSAVQKCIKNSVECKLYLSENENYPSLWLELTGDCVSLPEPKDTLNFECYVRQCDSKEVEIENQSGNDWQLVPIISGEYFKGYEVLIVPALSSATYTVNFCPLTMTEEKNFHTGSLLFKLPNGRGVLYHLRGTAVPPKSEENIERDVPCKTKYVELLKVKNWLQYPQRFKVNIMCLENQDDPSCSCTGFEYLEVPALAQKEYALNFFAYNVGFLKYNVNFTNEETKEYIWYELGFNVHMCGPLEVITLKSGIRQTCHHEIKLENPLTVPVHYEVETSSPEIQLDSRFHQVPPEESVYFTISFTPIHPGEKTETLSASCTQLGVFPRELRLIGMKLLPDPPRIFEAPLGSSVTHEFLVKNLSALTAVLNCKRDSEEFNFEEPGSVAAGQSTKIKVTYEPSEIGSTTATLSVESEQAGDFIFPLLGICVKPQAKGPYILKAGSGLYVPFKNVFRKTKEFYMYVDNPAFVLKTVQETLLSKEESKIYVGFQKMKHLEKLSEYKETEIDPKFPMMGQLVVECFNPYVKWQFYLKGVMEK